MLTKKKLEDFKTKGLKVTKIGKEVKYSFYINSTEGVNFDLPLNLSDEEHETIIRALTKTVRLIIEKSYPAIKDYGDVEKQVGMALTKVKQLKFS